jgi:hypothetical protein
MRKMRGVTLQKAPRKNIEISNFVTGPPPENTSNLADFQSRHGEAPRFAGKGREIALGRCWWPAPLQKTPQISPIFKADTVRLHVSREKDGKLHLVDAGGTIRRSFSRTAAGKFAGGGRAKPTPTGGAMTPPFKN